MENVMRADNTSITNKLINLLNQSIVPFDNKNIQFYSKIADLIGDARIVLMGEASHGTMEFYRARAALSEYLIKEKGFQAIAIEGDWTSACAVHHYCQGSGNRDHAKIALESCKSFPAWMWRNTIMLQFIQRLRRYNDQFASKADKIAFYGLDLYCLNEAAKAVINYLKQNHPEAAPKAILRYACFEHTQNNPQLYSYLLEKHTTDSCIREVTTQLLETQCLAFQKLSANADIHKREKQFYATQNARIVKNAEHYYRSLFEPHYVTWNIRDQHMVDTLENIISHLEGNTGNPAKVIVWAHNSHIGDARATEMSERQEINLGQLVRERFDMSSFLLGFSTGEGTVTAASEWDGEASYKEVTAPLQGSYEWLFQQLTEQNFLLNLREENQLTHLLKIPQLQRAIGVIYRPETERTSHYYFSRLSYQFDAIVHFNKTRALVPLDKKVLSPSTLELPETYPAGF
jgi:erythromycin esterase-like protein